MRGDITEARVLSAFAQHGLSVAIPFGHDDPYDLIVETRDFQLLRVQCKTARMLRRNSIMFKTCSTDHGNGTRTYNGRADLFGVYCEPIDRVFVVPVEGAPRYAVTLRLLPARNNQEQRIRHADDYDLARWVAEDGGSEPIAA